MCTSVYVHVTCESQKYMASITHTQSLSSFCVVVVVLKTGSFTEPGAPHPTPTPAPHAGCHNRPANWGKLDRPQVLLCHSGGGSVPHACTPKASTPPSKPPRHFAFGIYINAAHSLLTTRLGLFPEVSKGKLILGDFKAQDTLGPGRASYQDP